MWYCSKCESKHSNPGYHLDHMKDKHPEWIEKYYALCTDDQNIQQRGSRNSDHTNEIGEEC